MNIYVGNLAHAATQAQLKALFEQFGAVLAVKIMIDRLTGQPRGFAFITMENEDEANAAITSLEGHVLEGRPLRVSIARPPQPRENNGGRSDRPERSDRGDRSSFGSRPYRGSRDRSY